MRWTDHARFWSKVDVGRQTECWPWRASTSNGYGAFYVPGQGMVGAHRVAFFIAHGSWPPEHAAHSCDNPPCCNPNHLFAATVAENNADMLAKGRASGGSQPGSSNPNAKLSDEDVATIRSLYAAGGISQAVLARRFGVTQSGISLALRR